MQVQNNKEEVPFAHYEEKFRALDPIESAKRCGVPFAAGKFSVRLLGVAGLCHHRGSGWCVWPQQPPVPDVSAALPAGGQAGRTVEPVQDLPRDALG